ncbi:MAG: hypothetical protein QM589_01790 [Thermomicrobiales bacterium]
MSNPTSSPTTSRPLPEWALPAFRWLTVVNAVLIVVQAFLASQGFWGGEHGLITGHGQLGNLVFLLVVAQGVLAVMLANAGAMPRGVLVLAGLAVVLVVVQIALGYATRDDFKITAWHVTNGVLLMGIAAALAAIAWTRPAGDARS